MKERPILFSAAMVRALIDGSKTQTRRAVKVQPPPEARDAGVISAPGQPYDGEWSWLDSTDLEDAGFVGEDFRCPYGQPGDAIWVRETFFAYGRWETRYSEKKKRDEWHFVDMTLECDRVYQYAADNPMSR